MLEWVAMPSLLQGIVPTQESNLGLLHWRQILYPLSHQGSPINIHLILNKGLENINKYIYIIINKLLASEKFLISKFEK